MVEAKCSTMNRRTKNYFPYAWLMKADLGPWSPKRVRTPNLSDASSAKYDIQVGPAL